MRIDSFSSTVAGNLRGEGCMDLRRRLYGFKAESHFWNIKSEASIVISMLVTI